MYNNIKKDEALRSVGPAFEELSDAELYSTDAAATPVFVATGKILLTALYGSAVTITIDKIWK